MAGRVCQFLAVVFTALAFVPVGAHIMELPAKIDMPEEPYFVVQLNTTWVTAGQAPVGGTQASVRPIFNIIYIIRI